MKLESAIVSNSFFVPHARALKNMKALAETGDTEVIWQ
jgi:hypothetical protein